MVFLSMEGEMDAEVLGKPIEAFRKVVDGFLNGDFDDKFVESFWAVERQLIGSKMGIFDVEYEKKFREGFEGSFVGPIKVYLPSTDGRLRLQVIPRGRGIMMIECVGHGSPHREEMVELAIMNERLKEMAERLGGNYEVREKPKLTIIRN